MVERTDILVVGAGVSGLASALCLLGRGRSVRVLDAGRVGGGSSHGNCGTLTPSHAGPLHAPGMVAQALRWMFTPDAPFYVRPRLDPALWGWMLRFAARCNPRDWDASARARAAILNASRAAFPEWIARYRLDCQYSEPGADCVFRDPAQLDAYVRHLPALAALGIESRVIDGREYLAADPALREGLAGAVHFPGDAQLRPDRYVVELARAVTGAGGVIETGCEVTAAETRDDGMRVSTSLGERHARDIVLATGAWSPLLGRSLGLRWLRRAMQPGKGYSITYARPSLVPRRPLTLFERRVCVTVWEDGYRLGSTMEFSGHDATLNRRRLDALERGAAEYLREPVGPAKREEWYGWRPLSWDDLPIIGRAPGHRHLWLATGHGMLGVSMSTATGRLLAELVTGETPHLDPVPYSPERFA
ncbi:D-amino-acid dehydrogenase [Luteimonas sp. J16]|jgi:D-amino-acid dehydrogenase|uniref:NAD(P)/FAD-dependent oxidoreductase n=1 Tax=unclassified Luteimonas TaxID=2629088 RepID=UPI00047D6615|nr:MULTISPECIES: FAD-dependent oxidoreductase [unclassified Luteimonas]TWG91699.1 D-amino-acid dehydrogenase [Luteimonas sp. J16]